MEEDDVLRGLREAMMQALRAAFGDNAWEVARRQLEGASDDSSDTWRRIASALEA